jgi:HNH endonuclease
MVRGMKPLPVAARVKAYSKVNEATGCWEWQRYRKPSGYGTLSVNGESWIHAHRASYEAFVGPIGEGLWVLHRCDNRSCVNPSHLFLGSSQDNVDDRNRKARQPRGDEVGTSVLTWDKVREIRARFAAGGCSYKGLGDEYGVNGTTIKNVVFGVHWKE